MYKYSFLPSFSFSSSSSCRPQFLVLTGAPSSRPDMVHFISHISKEVGVMVCGQVLLVRGVVGGVGGKEVGVMVCGLMVCVEVGVMVCCW